MNKYVHFVQYPARTYIRVGQSGIKGAGHGHWLGKISNGHFTGSADIDELREIILHMESISSEAKELKPVLPWHSKEETPDKKRRVILRWDNSFYGREWDTEGYSIMDYLVDTAVFTDEESFRLDRKTNDSNLTIYINYEQVIGWLYESDLLADFEVWENRRGKQ